MRILIEAPQIAEKASGGLLKLANVIDTSGPLFHYGLEYEPAPGGQSREVPTDGSDKVYEDLLGQTVEGDPFGVYRGIDAALLTHHGEPEALVRELFAQGESFAVEKVIQREVFNAEGSVDLTPTPGTPVTNTRAALGLLEQYAGERYAGRPLLHTNRLGGSLLTDFAEGDGNGNLLTKLDTPVVIGSGYSATGPSGAAAPAGAAWVYVTGQVNIWRSPVQTYPAYDLKKNREIALAEAQYVPVVEAFTAAILIGS
jgi:hypothetical protein